MRRWSLRILIAVVVLLIVVIAVTQAVLSLTTVPDRIVLSGVQQQLGLRMTASSVDAGWFGKTVLKDVTLSLPLAEESLLATPELRVKHTWLPILLVTRKLVIDRLTLDDAQLVVRQDATGRWNLQDVVELLARTGGKQQADATSNRRSGPKLPGLVLHNATLSVTDKSGKTATLAPLEFTGLPEGLLVWRYEATAGSILQAVGQLSPGFEWKHQVRFEVNDAGELLKPWVGELADPLNVAGRWEGQLQAGQAVGRLTLAKLQAMGAEVSGVVRARAGGGAAVIEPQKLTVTTSQKMLPKIQIASGAIELTGSTVRARRVQVSALNGMAQVDGRWAMNQEVGEINATWDEIVQAGGVRHGGRLAASVTNTLGNRTVTADLATHGTVRGGQWDAEVKLTGGGREWNQMRWTLAAPVLSWKGPPREVVLDGLVAKIITRGKVLELTSVELPSAERVRGNGKIDVEAQAWSVDLSGRGWPLPRLPESTLEFRLDAAGDFIRYKLNELFLQSGDMQVSGNGFYDRELPKPLDLTLNVRHVTSATTESDPTIRGTLRAQARVKGVAWPLDVGLTGKVFGEALRVKGHVVGDVAIDVEGSITREHASITSNELEVLGGQWSLVGTWIGKENLARLNVRVRDLPLAQVGAAAGRHDVAGTLDGKWTFNLPDLDRARLTASGGFEARGVEVAGFPVERIVGQMTMKDGRIDAAPVELTQGAGKATANVSVALAAPKKPTIGLTASEWPINLPAAGAALKLSAETKLNLDLATRSATGPLSATADVIYREEPLGQARVAAELSGHSGTLKSLEADAFGGTAAGSASFSLDAPLATTGQLTWSDIDAAQIAKLFPRLEGLAGRFGGKAKLAPATDPRALEPLRLDIVLDSYGGSYRDAPIGDGTLTAFMNYEMGEAKVPGVGDRFRIVLGDRAYDPERGDGQEGPSFIRFGDGIVRIWGRLTRHRGVRQPAGQITLDLDRLSVDQLVHVGAPDADPMPGRLSGTLNLYGSLDFDGSGVDLSRLSGLGSLRITDSDLANFDVFTFLYERMNVLNWGSDKPQLRGQGSVDLRFEADTLYLSNIRYFNRGTEIRANANVRRVFRLPYSPLEGTAVGSVRPFSSLKLPLLADVDDVLAVLQSDVTPAVVGGTVKEPTVKLVPFGEIGASMRSLLLGDVRDETQGR
ncbi:MAG TPA: hypothetical protein VGR35_02595 [Tepidisphaeraceae bacterium]|nr:hypothetical protein [Tepidisphaeraceae bacterium]